MTISQIIEAAKALEIKITAAELETELCKQWEARVLAAKNFFDCGDYAMCQRMIDEANAYAI